MPLWTKQDTAAGAPKFLIDPDTKPAANTSRDYNGVSPDVSLDNAFLVDTTEAGIATNRAKGIKTPGWTLYREYGSGRQRVETLVAFKVAPGTSGDLGVSGNTATEDATVADS